MAGCALQLKESHCYVQWIVRPDNEDVFNCATEGCEGPRYKETTFKSDVEMASMYSSSLPTITDRAHVFSK